MALPSTFVQSLQYLAPREIAEYYSDENRLRGGITLEVTNEIAPADLFCYFAARFGPPNGIQSMLRRHDSDNLIHWEWTFGHDGGLFFVQGHNFRTEFHFGGASPWSDSQLTPQQQVSELVDQFRSDFSAHGKSMGQFRKHLESWTEFVNPYQRIRRSVERLMRDLEELKITDDRDEFAGTWSETNQKAWEETVERYSRGLGICFGVRSMLPILAESFVNLLLYILFRPEIKTDVRLRDNAIRQPIDVRIKSLGITCVGFASHPDYKHEACRQYHSLVNERNDLLHGNVVIDKLKFNDIFFLGTIPVFREYRSIWGRSLGVQVNAVGLGRVKEELRVVEALISYLISCVDEKYRAEVQQLVDRYELGLNNATQRLGILFPPWLVDFRAKPMPEDAEGS